MRISFSNCSLISLLHLWYTRSHFFRWDHTRSPTFAFIFARSKEKIMTWTRSQHRSFHHEVILFIQNWCKVIKMSDKVTWGHPRSGENTKFHAKLDNKMFGEEVKIIYEERMSLYFAHITYTAENYIIMHYWWTRSSSITTIFGSCSFVRKNTVTNHRYY